MLHDASFDALILCNTGSGDKTEVLPEVIRSMQPILDESLEQMMEIVSE